MGIIVSGKVIKLFVYTFHQILIRLYFNMGKSKFYVVWKGRTPGIYSTWAACEQEIKGYKGAKFKSFSTENEAKAMFKSGPEPSKKTSVTKTYFEKGYIENSLCVDAACSGNPGIVEYRGVYTATNSEFFRKEPIKKGTNNLGEFLAIVHGLALLKKEKSSIPIYSDSETAIKWTKTHKPKTTLKRDESTIEIWVLIDRAIAWLETNDYETQLLKWETKKWGEIPADYGRK
jgi:ribonuclease HI